MLPLNFKPTVILWIRVCVGDAIVRIFAEKIKVSDALAVPEATCLKKVGPCMSP